jgi:hypothetical protein
MTNWWNDTTGWAGWIPIRGGVASIGGAGSPVTSVHRTGQRVDVFTVGGDNHVWSALSSTSADWSGWSQIGTLTCRSGSTVTVISRNANQLLGRRLVPGDRRCRLGRLNRDGPLPQRQPRRPVRVGTDGHINSTFWDAASG